MATIEQIKELALHAARHSAPANFTSENVDDALKGELNKLAGSINQFMKNRYDIYDIIVQTADEIVPKKVLDAIGMFAEVQQTAQGQAAIFKKGRLGRARARAFLTQVGNSGVYETFRLDSSTFELHGHAVGGAVTIDFERMLDGAETMADVMDILTEGLVDSTMVEVHKAMRAAINAQSRPEANKVSTSRFDASEMVKLVSVVKAYGNGAAIFATPEFIAAMGPDAIVPVSGNLPGVYSPKDIDAIHDYGLINIFRGTPVIELQQSFIDETNTKTYLDPQLAYVLPTGGEKVVKVVLEGATQINDFKNRDNSMEIHAYKKIGAAILTHYNWGVYQNTAITQTYEQPYANL